MKKIKNHNHHLQKKLENMFSKDRNYFPEIVRNAIDESLEGDNKVRPHDCFNLQGFAWALSIACSRSCFLDSDWNPDDEMDLGLGGSKRVPGDGGLDW